MRFFGQDSNCFPNAGLGVFQLFQVTRRYVGQFLVTTCLALGPSGGWTNVQTDGQMDGHSPHSTTLCNLSGPLPKNYHIILAFIGMFLDSGPEGADDLWYHTGQS